MLGKTHPLPWAVPVTALLLLGACGDAEIDATSATSSAIATCAEGPTVRGIDVAKYQGDIDWVKVEASGIKFAFIKACNGVTGADPYFDRNWPAARQAGVIRGAYQFYQSDLDPIAQADHLLEVMGPLEPGDLPPMVDVEDLEGNVELDPAVNVARLQKWIDRIEEKIGVPPVIYTARWYWGPKFKDSTAFGTYPLAYAEYTYKPEACPNLPSGWKRWAFFQYSDKGTVPGIAAACDLDVFNGDLGALRAMTFAPTVCGDGKCGFGEKNTCAADCVATIATRATETGDAEEGCSAVARGKNGGSLRPAALVALLVVALSRRRRRQRSVL